jgi:hypothetical protein
MVDTNSKVKHGNEKTTEKSLDEKPDWRDMMIKEEVAEKQLVATEDAPRLRKEESTADDWRMKAETRQVQGDGLDDTKEAIEINEEDVVRQDFARIGSKT